MQKQIDFQRLRDEALQKVAENANWDKSAVENFVVEYLRRNGPASSEDITDAAKRAGHIPHDDRAFGPVYLSLSRARRIVFAGNNTSRRKGHASRGGYLWKAY